MDNVTTALLAKGLTVWTGSNGDKRIYLNDLAFEMAGLVVEERQNGKWVKRLCRPGVPSETFSKAVSRGILAMSVYVDVATGTVTCAGELSYDGRKMIAALQAAVDALRVTQEATNASEGMILVRCGERAGWTRNSAGVWFDEAGDPQI